MLLNLLFLLLGLAGKESIFYSLKICVFVGLFANNLNNLKKTIEVIYLFIMFKKYLTHKQTSLF